MELVFPMPKSCPAGVLSPLSGMAGSSSSMGAYPCFARTHFTTHSDTTAPKPMSPATTTHMVTHGTSGGSGPDNGTHGVGLTTTEVLGCAGAAAAGPVDEDEDDPDPPSGAGAADSGAGAAEAGVDAVDALAAADGDGDTLSSPAHSWHTRTCVCSTTAGTPAAP